jgi:PAS domain S-box-containing protein
MHKSPALPWAPPALFAAGLAAALGAGLWQQRANDIFVQERLLAAAERSAEALRRRLQTYEYGLFATRSALYTAGDAVETVSREQFHRYGASLDLPRQYPGATSFGFVRRVPQAQEADFVAAMRREGLPDFRIRQIQPHAGERFVVQYSEPESDNAESLGLDLASDPERLDTALAARRSGEPRLTPPITLPQAPPHADRAFVLLLPLYRGIQAPTEPARREAEAFGWAAVTLAAEAVLRGFGDEGGALAVALSDATGAGEAERFYASPAWSEPVPGAPLQQWRLPLYGRQWLLQAQPLPPFIERLHLRPPLELAVPATAAAGLLALLLAGWQRAELRERVIQEERERLAAVVESAHDAIVGHGPGDVITSWNPAAQRLLGWTEREALRRRLIDLSVPAWLREETLGVIERVQRGEDVPPFDTLRLDRQGRLVEVSVSVSPTRDARGRVSGAATTLRDLRAQREAQARIVELNVTLEQQVQQRTDEL